LTPEQRTRLARPESSLLLTGKNRFGRVHWLPRAEVPHWLPLLEERSRYGLKVLPPYQRLEEGQGWWLVVDSSGQRAEPWKEPRGATPLEEVQRLCRFVQSLTGALEELHDHNLVWLNFDPGELEIVSAAEGSRAEEKQLRITNLDLEVYPAGYCPERLTLKPAFAAPEVCRGLGEEIGPRTDVFHLALFCYYWLARRLPGGFPGAGLEAFGFQMPALRTFVPDLPMGLTGVISKGLALEAAERWASPGAFSAALEESLKRLEKRLAFAGPLTWEIGAHTRTGRAKSMLEGDNQDCVLTREFADPARAFVAVADGITTCDVGNGALASSLAVNLLEETFTASCQQEEFPAWITIACDRAARDLLDWAIAEGQEGKLREGLDLMGTTLTAAWLQGNWLQLANLGDSRAYLLNGKSIEQLTVDGDLASGLLMAGTPPEQIRELGGLSRALRECIGGCHISATGELQPLPDCFPSLSRFPLLPGDVVILCTDGLVEEGAFLEPGDLLETVRNHPELSAQELAVLLADQADALQRLPSLVEPEGYGDNISCIVIKLAGSVS
jgi:serine/threonine protein phosphatase PrpC